MRIYPLALIAGLLPLFAIHGCYIWAVHGDHVPACIPYLHSCTSISSAGRLAPEYFLFKGLMIPAAVFIVAFWWYAYQWLVALGCLRHRTRFSIVSLGVIACLGLILYSLMLGAIGEEYRMQRKIGVIIFFTLTFIAQALLVLSLSRLQPVRASLSPQLSGLKILLGIIGGIAFSAVVISSINSDFYDKIEDAFEWWVTSLQCVYVLIVAMMWKKTNYRVQVSVSL